MATAAPRKALKLLFESHFDCRRASGGLHWAGKFAFPVFLMAKGDTDDSQILDQTLVTKEGLKKLQEELENLKTVRRKEVAERLKEAISYGDLSENSEYQEAKNEQAFTEGRILELEQMIKNAKIISDSKSSSKGKDIQIGATVTICNKTDNDDPVEYTIVGSTEANPLEHKISNESPVGRALLGKKKGDIIDVKTPAGPYKYEVVKVS